MGLQQAEVLVDQVRAMHRRAVPGNNGLDIQLFLLEFHQGFRIIIQVGESEVYQHPP
jgi:hypothetical protein